jgi:hypothetical protein
MYFPTEQSLTKNPIRKTIQAAADEAIQELSFQKHYEFYLNRDQKLFLCCDFTCVYS